jgi:hypothetical protein
MARPLYVVTNVSKNTGSIVKVLKLKAIQSTRGNNNICELVGRQFETRICACVVNIFQKQVFWAGGTNAAL